MLASPHTVYTVLETEARLSSRVLGVVWQLSHTHSQPIIFLWHMSSYSEELQALQIEHGSQGAVFSKEVIHFCPRQETVGIEYFLYIPPPFFPIEKILPSGRQ